MTTAQQISPLSNRSPRRIFGSLLTAALIASSIVWFSGRAQASSDREGERQNSRRHRLEHWRPRAVPRECPRRLRCLKGAPYKVNFVEFDSGPLVNAGFAAHQIDLGYMGDLPAALAVQSGLPVKAVAAILPIGASEFLLAKPGITSIAQLKGQPVAFTTGTAEQAFAPARARVRWTQSKGRHAGQRGAPTARHRPPNRCGSGVSSDRRAKGRV